MDVRTAARALAIFEAFSKARRPLTLAEIARAIEAPASSGLYLVRTLEMAGYLYRTGLGKSFYPTRKMLNISNTIAESEPWLEGLIPTLEALRDDTRETVILGKLHGNKIVYLATLDGTETMRFSARPGDVRPVHSTAIGKALFAALPSPQQTRLIGKIEFKPITEATITDPDAFLADIATIPARGYAVSRGESAQGVMAIAQTVSVLSETFAISLVGLADRMNAVLDRQVARLTEACDAIEDLGQLQGGAAKAG